MLPRVPSQPSDTTRGLPEGETAAVCIWPWNRTFGWTPYHTRVTRFRDSADIARLLAGHPSDRRI